MELIKTSPVGKDKITKKSSLNGATVTDPSFYPNLTAPKLLFSQSLEKSQGQDCRPSISLG